MALNPHEPKRKINTQGGNYREIDNQGFYSEGDINISLQRIDDSVRSKAEKNLLHQVGAETASRLKQSLHNQVFITLEKQELVNQVTRPWDYEVKLGADTTEKIASNTTILEIFDRTDIQGRLLILGQPGSGKSTTMLDLARELLERAHNPEESIPVLMNLSTWASKQQSIPEWLIGELNSKYGVQTKLGKHLLQERKLLCLLDGLDEVSSNHQRDCIEALNQWISGQVVGSSPGQFVVCSRIEEYEQLDAQLQMNGAICLTELSEHQIQGYLESVNRVHLWSLISHNPALKQLLRAPLFLSMLVLIEPLIQEEQQRLQDVDDIKLFLIDAYINRMLKKAKKYNYTPRQMRLWLVWLARWMELGRQTEFLVEKIQPTWLTNTRLNLLFELQIRLICGLTAGLIVGLVAGTFFGLNSGLIVGLFSGPRGGFIGVLITIFSRSLVMLPYANEMIIPMESLSWSWSWSRAKDRMLVGLIAGLMGSLVFGLPFGLFVGLLVGLSGGQSFGARGGLVGDEIKQRVSLNQGIWTSLKLGLIQSLIFGLIFGLTSGLVFGLGNGLIFGLVGGLLSGLNGGLGVFISHFTLRQLLYVDGCAPWDYPRFLVSCSQCLLLQQVGGRFRFIHKTVQEHFSTMEFDQAIIRFDKAVEMRPNSWRAWHNRANALLHLGRYEEALSNFDKALSNLGRRDKPLAPLICYLRGVTLFQLGRHEEALSSFDKVVEMLPTFHQAYYARASVYALLNQVEPALVDLEHAIKLKPRLYRTMAQTDSDFDLIRTEKQFQAIINSRPKG